MSNAETKTGFAPLENGDYLIRMNRIEEKTSAKGGKYLSAGFEVINGDNKGRLIFHNFMTEHTNPVVIDIGKQQLSKYLLAVGVENGLEGIGEDLTRVEEYTELPFVATLDIQKGNEYVDRITGKKKMGKDRNVIKSFRKR